MRNKHLSVLGRSTESLSCCSSSCKLGSLDCAHLVNPSWGWLWSPDSSDFVCGETWNTNVVLSFEDDLDITTFETVGTSEFGEFAAFADDVVDKFVHDLEEDL